MCLSASTQIKVRKGACVVQASAKLLNVTSRMCFNYWYGVIPNEMEKLGHY